MDALGRAAYAGKMVWWEDVGDLALHYEGLLRAMSRELAAERAMVAVLTGERMPDGTRGPPIGKYSRLAESSRRAARARARQYQLKIRYEAGGTISERTHMLADELEASVAPKQGHRFEHRLYTHDAITILDQKPGLRKSFEKLHCLRRKPTARQWVRMDARRVATQSGDDEIRKVLGPGVKCGHSTETREKQEQLLEFKGKLLACGGSETVDDGGEFQLPLAEQRAAEVKRIRDRKAALATEKAALIVSLKDGTFVPPRVEERRTDAEEEMRRVLEDEETGGGAGELFDDEHLAEAAPGVGVVNDYGISQMVDGVQTLVFTRLRGDIPLLGSPALNVAGKFSLDALSHNGSAWTTGFLEFKAVGVTGRDWGKAAIQHQLHSPQSGDLTLPVFTYPGPDKGGPLQHAKRRLEQILEQLTGQSCEMDSIADLPPDCLADDGKFTRLALNSKGVGGADFRGKQLKPREGDTDRVQRERLLEGVMYTFQFLFPFDGATFLAITGVSIAEDCNSPHNLIGKANQYRLLELRKVPGDYTWRELAAELRPDDPSFLPKLCWANRHELQPNLQTMTLEPLKVVNMNTTGQADTFGRGRRSARTERDTAAPQPQTVYADPLIASSYEPRAFQPSLNGASFDPTATIGSDEVADAKVPRETLVRVPIPADCGSRPLGPKALLQHDELLPRMVECLMHGGAMRMPESELGCIEECVRDVLTSPSLPAAKLTAINHANESLKLQLGSCWKHALRLKKPAGGGTATCPTPELGGAAGKVLMRDVAKERADVDVTGDFQSHYFRNRALLFKELGLHANLVQLPKQAACLRHWAVAMLAGYKLKPTEEERTTFSQELGWYCLKSAALFPEHFTWYKAQSYHVFSELMERHHSLKLLDQTAPEAVQKTIHQVLKKLGGFATKGNIDTVIKEHSEAARVALMLLRKKYQASKAEAVFDELLNIFIAKNGDSLDRAFELREAGLTIPWADFCLLWLRWRRLSQWKNRVVAALRERKHPGYARSLLAEWRAHRRLAQPFEASPSDPRGLEVARAEARKPLQRWWAERVRARPRAAYCAERPLVLDSRV